MIKEDKLFKIKGSPHHLISAIKAINIIITKQITTSPEEDAFLMELMSVIANQQSTEKKIEILVTPKQGQSLWHCCRVVVDNADKLCSNEAHLNNMCEIMSGLAEQLDEYIEKTTKTKLELV
jgi:hypothetical protein